MSTIDPNRPAPVSAPASDGGQSEPSFVTYPYDEQLFARLDSLVESSLRLDALVIDLMEIGFAPPLDTLVRFGQYAERVLKLRGILLLVQQDGAITLSKDEPGKGLTYNYYSNPMDTFLRHPLLAEHVCVTVPGIDRRRLTREGGAIANHILFTSIPVLTEHGKRTRDMCVMPPQDQCVAQLIDDYTTVEAIARNAEAVHGLTTHDTLRLLQKLESEAMIYPIFVRIQFLYNCLRKQQAFRLGRYMVASGIVTERQLQELLEQKEEPGGKVEKYLGLRAVKAGYLGMRQLEVMLADQYLYGGFGKTLEDMSTDGSRTLNVERMQDSMIGSLGAIDAPGLLQSFSTARKTGLLSIEDRGKTVLIAFENGKATHARMHRLVAKDAVVEMLSTWTQGIFLFRDGGTSPELKENCRLANSLEKMMLDSALASDHIKQIHSYLPAGGNTILERRWDFEGAWQAVAATPLQYIDESPVNPQDWQMLHKLANSCDGLAKLDEVTQQLQDYTTHMLVKGAYVLLQQNLLRVQQASFFQPLSVFQAVINQMQSRISAEDNCALLTKSLHYVHGNSNIINRFQVDKDCRVSINLQEVGKAGIPVSVVIADLKRWMTAYLAYCRRLIGSDTVDFIVNQTMGAGQEPR